MHSNLVLIDTHVHTSEVSLCGWVTATDMVRHYKDAGYEGIIITDHYHEGYFGSLGALSWDEKIKKFLSGYKIAKEKGKELGLKVFLGMEIRFHDGPEDYLVYGLDEEYLVENPKLYEHNLKTFRAYIKETGAMIFQAHPFRPGQVPAKGELLDGLEIYNGNPRHNSQNHRAHRYAERNGLIMNAGSDAHQIEDVGRAGIYIPKGINTVYELNQWFRTRPWDTNHIYIEKP